MTDTRDRSAADDGQAVAAAVQGKTRFDDIYDRPDPTEYFRTLARLEYQTPHHAQRVFERLIAARAAAAAERPVTVLDVCCSYGINAALLNHDLTLADLYARYTDAHILGEGPEQLAEKDRVFYEECRHGVTTRVIGLDSAPNAVAYARGAGLLDAAFGQDLERAEPGPELAAALRPVQLITVTGGIGYITDRTLERILSHVDGPVWVAAFVLRTVPYRYVADALERFGLHTQKATSRTFPQRRFSGADEQRSAIEAVRATGASPEGKETAGYYHCDFYLSRPAEHLSLFAVDDLLSVS
ncbi:hypothetical protein ACFQ2B_32590 [Streptomyces stramineus]|uniref:Class I SAM-dependent methyltransferase n=1 Tax=Streptomyces stramineus TaxID=173861 RepID=A0ABP3L3K9_9ACTN